MNRVKLFACLSALLLIISTPGYAQKNYFYTGVKAPVVDYISHLLSNNDGDYDDGYNSYNQNDEVDGAIFDLGYGLQLHKLFILETGAEIFLFNPSNHRYYASAASALYDELNISNRAFSFQVKPTLNLELGEDIFLRASCGINYRKLYSSGTYFTGQDETGQSLNRMSTAKSRSVFAFNMQPSLGLNLEVDEHLGIGVDLTYVHVNWDNSLSGLRFDDQPGLLIPSHRTSNVFMAIRLFFR